MKPRRQLLSPRAFALAAAVAVMLTVAPACNPAKRNPTLTPDTPTTPDEQLALRKIKSGDNVGAARIYANLAEGVFFDHGPAVANPLIDKALAQDPNNSKAAFYSAVIKPLMVMSGFFPRMEGLLFGDDPHYELHARDDLQRMGFPELYSWAYEMPSGQTPFATLHDVQRFLRTELLPVLENSEAAFNKLDPSNPPALLFSFSKYKPRDPNLQDGAVSHQRPAEHHLTCAQRPTDGTWYCQPGQKGVLPRAVTLDASDIRVLQHAVRAIGDYIRLNTAYSTEGWEMARIRLTETHLGAHGITLADAQVLSQFPNLFTLESDQLLWQIKDSTYAALEAAEDLHAMSNVLCGAGTAALRIKANAFFASICVYKSLLEAVDEGLQVLTGPAEVRVGWDQNDKAVMLAVDVPQILGSPPRDLKPLLVNPAARSADQVAFPDASFGGLFPNADFVSVFSRDDRRNTQWTQVPQHMGSYGFIPYPYR